MKNIILVVIVAILAIAAANMNQEITYDSPQLVVFNDGVKYDTETNTIYTKGKLARWSVKRAEKAFKESGDKEFWMDNNKHGENYKCVKVDNIVYDKN